MVALARTTVRPRLHAGELSHTRLNRPQPLSVTCDTGGQPHTVTLDGNQLSVAEIVDTWLVEDEWWRAPIARRYVAVMLADGRLITLFEDLVGRAWYRQGYR